MRRPRRPTSEPPRATLLCGGPRIGQAKYVGETGPLSICVDASSWQTYRGGVLRGCGTRIDHCVQAVGIDTTNGVWKVPGEPNQESPPKVMATTQPRCSAPTDNRIGSVATSTQVRNSWNTDCAWRRLPPTATALGPPTHSPEA